MWYFHIQNHRSEEELRRICADMGTGARGKGQGNKIDPSRAAIPASSIPPSSSSLAITIASNDRTLALSDEIMLRILSFVAEREEIDSGEEGEVEQEGEEGSPCFLVCKRWCRLRGRLKTRIRVRQWSFVENGAMVSRFPNLVDVDLTGAWLASPATTVSSWNQKKKEKEKEMEMEMEKKKKKQQLSEIVLTHGYITVGLAPDAYFPFAIDKFIESCQVEPDALDRGLEVLADGCPSLRRLCLIDVQRSMEAHASNGSGIGKDLSARRGLAYLAMKCSTLQDMVLKQCTDESLLAISTCRNLQVLKLAGLGYGFFYHGNGNGNGNGNGGCSFTDIGLTILAKGCTRLVKLSLSGCEASYDGIAAIGQCCFMLEELTLSNRGFCEGWIAALSYCTCLKTLRLEGCEQIDPAPGPSEHLYSCPALQRLEIVRCNLRDKAGFGALVVISAMIRELLFQDCWGLDDDTFKLVGSCRRVRFLSLEGCALLTTSGIEAVVVMWRELHTLQVSCCDSVSDSEIGPALAAVFSTLKVLKWCPDIKSLLTESLAGTGVGQAGGKFFRRAQ